MVLQYLVNCYSGTPVAATDIAPAHHIIELPDKDPHLLIIYNLLHRATHQHETVHTLQHYTRLVHIPISYEAYQRYGLDLSRDAVVAVNNRIQEHILRQLDMILQFYTTIGFELKDAIEIFRQVYKFPEEAYSSDAISKHWQRNTRKKITAHNIIAKTVLQRYLAKTA